MGNGPISCDASDITGATASTYVSDISINVEVNGRVPNGGGTFSYSVDDKQEGADEGECTLVMYHVYGPCIVCVCVHVYEHVCMYTCMCVCVCVCVLV